MSATVTSGRSTPAATARPCTSTARAEALAASVCSSSVGVNVPASLIVSELESASTMPRRYPANASHGSPPSVSDRSLTST